MKTLWTIKNVKGNFTFKVVAIRYCKEDFGINFGIVPEDCVDFDIDYISWVPQIQISESLKQGTLVLL